MIEKNVTIINKLGLHARATAKLIATTSRFSADIRLNKAGREVDAKSIMAVMMLAASIGTELKITTKGEDEVEAMDAVVALINNRFDEEE
jgi:phosphocarrier protein HPr